MTFQPITSELVVDHHMTLDETTATGVAVASYQGALHLAWTGSWHAFGLWKPAYIHTTQTTEGFLFAPKQRLKYASLVGALRAAREGDLAQPSLSAGPGGLMLAWKNSWRSLLQRPLSNKTGSLAVLKYGSTETQPTVVPQRPAGPPAIVVWQNEAAIAWMNRYGRISIAHSHQGVFGQATAFGKRHIRSDRRLPIGWDTPQPPASGHTHPSDAQRLGKATWSPAMCVMTDRIVVAWAARGPKGRRQVNLVTGNPDGFSPPTIIPRAHRVTALCDHHGELAVAWKAGWRREFNIGFLRSGHLLPSIGVQGIGRNYMGGTLNVNMCTHGQHLVVTWPGKDHRINVAYLRRVR